MSTYNVYSTEWGTRNANMKTELFLTSQQIEDAGRSPQCHAVSTVRAQWDRNNSFNSGRQRKSGKDEKETAPTGTLKNWKSPARWRAFIGKKSKMKTEVEGS